MTFPIRPSWAQLNGTISMIGNLRRLPVLTANCRYVSIHSPAVSFSSGHTRPVRWLRAAAGWDSGRRLPSAPAAWSDQRQMDDRCGGVVQACGGDLLV